MYVYPSSPIFFVLLSFFLSLFLIFWPNPSFLPRSIVHVEVESRFFAVESQKKQKSSFKDFPRFAISFSFLPAAPAKGLLLMTIVLRTKCCPSSKLGTFLLHTAVGRWVQKTHFIFAVVLGYNFRLVFSYLLK